MPHVGEDGAPAGRRGRDTRVLQTMTHLRLGFTGTRFGLKLDQYLALKALIKLLNPDELHHGDCLGADEETHYMALIMDIPVIIHPPVRDSLRARCQGAYMVCTTRPYLERNRAIVDDTDYVVAAPMTRAEDIRGGTWSTVRYARRQGKAVFAVYPDGGVKVERIGTLL